jgi:hypothetical protein
MFPSRLLENSSLAETFPSGSVIVSLIRPSRFLWYHPTRLNAIERATATEIVASAADSTRVSHKGLTLSDRLSMLCRFGLRGVE